MKMLEDNRELLVFEGNYFDLECNTHPNYMYEGKIKIILDTVGLKKFTTHCLFLFFPLSFSAKLTRGYTLVKQEINPKGRKVLDTSNSNKNYSCLIC